MSLLKERKHDLQNKLRKSNTAKTNSVKNPCLRRMKRLKSCRLASISCTTRPNPSLFSQMPLLLQTSCIFTALTTCPREKSKTISFIFHLFKSNGLMIRLVLFSLPLTKRLLMPFISTQSKLWLKNNSKLKMNKKQSSKTRQPWKWTNETTMRKLDGAKLLPINMIWKVGKHFGCALQLIKTPRKTTPKDRIVDFTNSKRISGREINRIKVNTIETTTQSRVLSRKLLPKMIGTNEQPRTLKMSQFNLRKVMKGKTNKLTKLPKRQKIKKIWLETI